MSVPYVDGVTWVPFAVLVASLAGSGHCVAMCGGLVVAAARTRAAWIRFHLGRLLGYLGLGALAGLIGAHFLKSGQEASSVWQNYLSWGSTLLLSFAFIAMGIQVWRGRPPHLPLVPASVSSWLFRKSVRSATLTGLLTALLPCGWLHSFVLGAVATRDPLLGAGFLFLFWMGTLPALGIAPWVFDRLLGPLARRSPKLAAITLLAAAAMSIGMKMGPQVLNIRRAEAPRSCH